MEEIHENIPLRCAFCMSTSFEIPHTGYQPQPGEMLKCGNCGRLNDYESILRVAEEQGVEFVNDKVNEELCKILKGSGFKIS